MWTWWFEKLSSLLDIWDCRGHSTRGKSLDSVVQRIHVESKPIWWETLKLLTCMAFTQQPSLCKACLVKLSTWVSMSMVVKYDIGFGCLVLCGLLFGELRWLCCLLFIWLGLGEWFWVGLNSRSSCLILPSVDMQVYTAITPSQGFDLAGATENGKILNVHQVHHATTPCPGLIYIATVKISWQKSAQGRVYFNSQFWGATVNSCEEVKWAGTWSLWSHDLNSQEQRLMNACMLAYISNLPALL